MKKIAFLLLLAQGLWAQSSGVLQSTKDALTLGKLKIGQHNSMMLYGFDNRTSEVIGDYYYDTEWALATVKFYPKTILTPKGTVRLDSVSDVLVRIILQGNDVEFATADGIKVLPGAMLQKIKFQHDVFLNSADFIDKDSKIKPTFLRVVYDGKIKLYEYNKIAVQKPDYVEALSVGSRDTKILKEKVYYIVKDNSKNIEKIALNRKNILELMEDKRTDIQKYLSMHEISFKNPKEVAELMAFYEQK